jgi:MFS-type transporter involved in bile tolerance (Atg22 family)
VPSPSPPRSAFLADLRSVLSESGFRRLFATRLVSQTGDGLFNAGFAAYVFFGATSFPNPAAAAEAFAVLYLPYSLIGPFAGVFIDRWSRRQILVWSALIRSVMVAVTAVIVASGNLGLPLYIGVLAVLGVNRFFLAALSAATPHVVAEDKLVMANSVAPTSGTIVGFIGGILGLAVHLVTGGGHIGSAATLLAAGALYVAAGVTGMTMARDLLGPKLDPSEPQPGGILAEVADVARGLAAGARHLWERRKAAAAIIAIGSHRFLYGILLLMVLLLYRNYFYAGGSGNAALGHGTLVVITSAVGYGAAALITPVATKRMSKEAWITWMLAAGGVLTGVLGTTFRQIPFLAAGFALGVVSQGVKICADTLVQQNVDDAYRGRIFSIYDLVFNAAYVAGPALAAPFLPVTGKSYVIIALLAVGYLLAAAGFVALNRGRAVRPERPEPEPSPAPR